MPEKEEPVAPAVVEMPKLLNAPFTQAEARTAQQAWAGFLGKKVEVEIDLGGEVKLVWY